MSTFSTADAVGAVSTLWTVGREGEGERKCGSSVVNCEQAWNAIVRSLVLCCAAEGGQLPLRPD